VYAPLFLSSTYVNPSTCAVGCFLSVIGGALVELYDFFALTFLKLVSDFTQGPRISSSVLPSYRFVTDYQVGILGRKVESSTSLLVYCSCSLLFFSGVIVRGHNAYLSERHFMFQVLISHKSLVISTNEPREFESGISSAVSDETSRFVVVEVD